MSKFRQPVLGVDVIWPKVERRRAKVDGSKRSDSETIHPPLAKEVTGPLNRLRRRSRRELCLLQIVRTCAYAAHELCPTCLNPSETSHCH